MFMVFQINGDKNFKWQRNGCSPRHLVLLTYMLRALIFGHSYIRVSHLSFALIENNFQFYATFHLLT